MNGLISLPLMLLWVGLALGGSLCPPRENIYPCSCANVHQSKKLVHTVVSCHRLKDSASLKNIFPALRVLQIDQFHLVDSFWGLAGQLPEDWLTLLKVKEMEIVDTELAPCFACQWKLTCKNSATTRFTIMNSTSGDSLCTLCDTGKGKFAWTNCLNRLKHLHLSHGRLTSLGGDAFPFEMSELTLLNLTHNRISKVVPRALGSLKKLTMLDLSHNAIESIDFIEQTLNLELLDLSWNNIKTIGQIFQNLPSLKTFKVASNAIVNLEEGHWKDAPGSLWHFDISDNPLHCDCSVRFVNATFHVSAIVLGTCSSPPDYENSALRKASRKLNERCDEEGSIGTRKKLVTLAMPNFRDV